VLVNRTSIVSAIANVSDPAIGDPTRFLATQASVARSPVLAGRVAQAAHVPGASAGALLGASSVRPESSADLLDVSVSWSNPDGAARLANAYAQGYTRYKTELDTKRIDDALATLRQRIDTLKSSGATSSPSYATLLEYQSQLETIGTLLANNTSVLRPAEGAVQVRPKPLRRAILGGLLGIVLGVALAFLAEALDRRIRSEEELEQVLGVPLIGRVPKPPRHLSDVNELVMIAEPESIEAESIRRLKTSIEFLNLERAARTIMVTSAVPREGKSTTVANLAVAFARSGRRVALVDLDIRRPFLHRFFHVGLGLGVTDIVAGAETVGGALRPLVLPGPHLPVSAPARNGKRSHTATEVGEPVESKATLSLMPAGTGSATGAEALSDILESERLAAVLDELADEFDVVLVDTPPLLAVGDAMALTARVDALVLVLHAGVQRPLVDELARQLHSSRAPTLGFVLTGVTPSGDGYGSGYSYGYDAYIYRAPRKKTERRVGRS
jgi:Mrp family chromosome partitioning ATPase